MRTVRALLVLGGLAAVAYMVAITGVPTLLAPIGALSWRLAVFLVFPYAVVALFHTLGWQLAFARLPVSFRRLFGIRLAGEVLNLAAASVGGEPVKVFLLQPAVPLVEASAAQVVDKTGITVGQVLFLAVGLGVAFPLFDLPRDFLRAMVALLGIQVVVVCAFVVVQSVGMFGWAVRLWDGLGLRASGAAGDGLRRLDRTVAGFYRRRPGRVLGCVVSHLLGWIAGSLEVYLVLEWLGVGGSFADALVIDAFGTGVKFMAFAIPGALGALEGGYMFAFNALGFGGGLGLSFTLIRRVRMLAWSALGLLILALLRSSADSAARSAAPRPASAP